MAQQITLPDFLTEAEIRRAARKFKELSGGTAFHTWCVDELIMPNMDRINKALGQENDARYLAYAVEYVLGQTGT